VVRTPSGVSGDTANMVGVASETDLIP
jgi:hypothetical protein